MGREVAAASSFDRSLVPWGMRAWITAGIVAVGVLAVIAAGTAPAPVAAANEPLKCMDCDGQSCHAVYGPAAQSCILTEEGCVAWGDCG